MFIDLALVLGVLALLVLVGRAPARARLGLRAVRILVGVLGSWLGQAVGRRPDAPPPDSQGAGGMTFDQACAILGVGPAATRAEIEAAYRRLIRRAHPDQGGTTGLAAQLNAARDRLLK